MYILIHMLHLFLQGYKQYRGYIIAQAPMEGTCRDFWKMLYDRKCGVVIMLSQLEEHDKVRRLHHAMFSMNHSLYSYCLHKLQYTCTQ